MFCTEHETTAMSESNIVT